MNKIYYKYYLETKKITGDLKYKPPGRFDLLKMGDIKNGLLPIFFWKFVPKFVYSAKRVIQNVLFRTTGIGSYKKMDQSELYIRKHMKIDKPAHTEVSS